jgi:hypothetical protein
VTHPAARTAVPVAAVHGPATGASARHAPDVPVVEAVGRHDDRMIVPEPAEPPAAAHREGAP